MQPFHLFLDAITTEAQGLHRQGIGSAHSPHLFNEVCPACSKPAARVIRAGAVLFVHCVTVDAGQVVRADYHRAPAPRDVRQVPGGWQNYEAVNL